MAPGSLFTSAHLQIQGQSDINRLQYEYEKKLRQMQAYYYMPAGDVYQSYNTREYRSASDVQEIERLKSELAEKKQKRSNEIKNLIAYYYKR